MSYADRFKIMKDRWSSAQPASGSARHPEGNFQGRMDKAQLQEGKTGKRKGHLLVVFVIKGLTGEAKGNTTFETCDLDFEHKTFSGISQLKGILNTLSVAFPKNLTEKSLKSALAECVGCVVDYTVRANGQFTNTYVNRLVNAADESPEDIEDDELDEDKDTDDDVDDDDEEDDDEDNDDDDDDLDLEDDDEDTEVVAEPVKKTKRAKKAAKKAKKKPTTTAAESDGDEDWDDKW